MATAPASPRATPTSDEGPSVEVAATVPQDVLVGTDVEKLSDYLARKAAVKFPSSYAGEQGGATAIVQLLVLEKRSGVDSIPPSLWIFYEHKNKKSPKK